MSQHHHRRESSNCFLGITDAALRAGIEYAKQLLALQWFQHNRDRLIAQGKAVSDLIFTIENPRATIEQHPLTRLCVLRPCAAGGLWR